MSNVDVPTGWALILAAIALAFFVGRSLHRNPQPPLTREPDLFDEQATYGPRAMYGPLEPIDEGDPFAGWSREEFDALTKDEWAWRLFEEIDGLPSKEDVA